MKYFTPALFHPYKMNCQGKFFKQLFFDQSFYYVQKISKEITTFDNIKIEKHKFHNCKNLTLLKDVDIEKISGVSKTFLLVKKNMNILLVTKMRIIKLNNYA